mgnify:CR=1 FL=1
MDTGYTIVGVLVLAFLVWPNASDNGLFAIGLLMVATYVAGRVAGSHR